MPAWPRRHRPMEPLPRQRPRQQLPARLGLGRRLWARAEEPCQRAPLGPPSPRRWLRGVRGTAAGMPTSATALASLRRRMPRKLLPKQRPRQRLSVCRHSASAAPSATLSPYQSANYGQKSASASCIAKACMKVKAIGMRRSKSSRTSNQQPAHCRGKGKGKDQPWP